MKSHVSVLLELATHILMDVLAMCPAHESAARDLVTLRSRIKHEGLSFLTITLPSFGADFERCLHLGYVDSKYFRAFRKYRKIPAFLRGIFSLVFDADTGKILPVPSVEAVKGIRQLAYTFKKLKLACSPHRVSKAFDGYVQDELDLNVPLTPDLTEYFCQVSDVLWRDFSNDILTNTFDYLPKHGPGATAERISGNAKYIPVTWHERLEQYFPMDSFAFANVNALDSPEFEKVTLVPEDDEMPVRVITVPKTLKSPRIIAIEPVCMQYTQQAISRVLIKELESNSLTAGHVNFHDQSVNRDLAMISSRDGLMATLDLSSASDRVPLSLVTCMLASSPVILGAILACRSKKAQIPRGDIISLRKFASMGSALCFPIESMYFYTLCIAARLVLHDLPVTRRNIYNVSRRVYVYGDDIIVPADEAGSIIGYLQKYYCKVNMSKSFWNGNFRESCGMDAFMGEQVTPVYVREMPPDDRQNTNALISWVETSNLLYKSGYWLTSSYLLSRCERLLGKLPVVGDQCAGLGKVSFQQAYSTGRWNKSYQCAEVRTWVAGAILRKDELHGYPALLKCFLAMEERKFNSCAPTVHGDHLRRSARHGAVALKRRWVRPY